MKSKNNSEWESCPVKELYSKKVVAVRINNQAPLPVQGKATMEENVGLSHLLCKIMGEAINGTARGWRRKRDGHQRLADSPKLGQQAELKGK